jgi:pimeloyl-ACP methyl ester carboxylesterase
MSSSPHSVPDAPPVVDLLVPVDEEDANPVSLYVRHRPGAGGRPFLLMHGLLSNARMWDEVGDRLAAHGHPVYAVDLRAHGRSDAPAGGYDNATAGRDVARVCAELGLTGALVAGHSWSANLALRLAVEHPPAVAGVALIDGGWFDYDSPVSRMFWGHISELFRRAQVGTSTPATMHEYLRFVHPTWSETSLQARLADYQVGPDGLLVPRQTEAQLTSIVDSLRDDSPRSWLPHIQVPVLLMPHLPTAMATYAEEVRQLVMQTAAALPRSTVRWYQDADHHLHAELPDQVAADLLGLAREAR